MRICSGAGCLRAVEDGVRFCAECQPASSATTTEHIHTNTDRERYGFLYSSLRWQQLRSTVVREQPLCAVCRRTRTAIVDHIVPAGVAVAQAQASGQYTDKWAGFFLRSNLQGLCRSCHLWKTIDDKRHSNDWPDVTHSKEGENRRRFCF
jgi:5-methylcytosine-specific restriction endonuclease McrA